MSNSAVALYRVYELPWSTGFEDDARFKKFARHSLVVALVLAVVLWFLPQPKPDPATIADEPKRLARLVLERPPPPPPPPVVREEPKPAEPEPVVEERRVEPEPKPDVKPPPTPEPPPVDRTQQARERARVAGLLPLTNQLQALRNNVTNERLQKTDTVAATASSDAPFSERSLITSRVGTASGGINTATLSRNTGGSGLGARETTQVASPVEGFAEAGGAAQRTGASDKGSRSREEIERVFDANKGRIYTLYNRALRENPALQGKVVLRLTIASDGRVTFCEIVSSELNDPELEKGLVQRVLQFQFEPRNDIESITTTKPIDFFPA
jgi:periplasmic protein TonB